MHDSIIVGAGVAGLAAGQRLRAAGRRPLLVEARERVGGRVFTDRSYGPVEFGAEFIHGEHAATWEFVRAAGLSTTGWEGGRLFAKGGVILPEDDPVTARTFELYDAALSYQGEDISVRALFDTLSDPADPAHLFALRWLANVEGADTTQLSASALTREHVLATNGELNFHIHEGYDRVIAKMAEGLDIRLGAAVEQVDWGGRELLLRLANGEELSAEKVILTVPLNVLKSGRPSFDPPLPSGKQQALRSIAMGQVTKLVLWFDQKFWQDFVVLSTDGRIATWWPVESAEVPTLMGYTGGPAALEVAGLGEQGAIEVALAELSQLFGVDVRSALRGGHLADWSHDPWSLGAYTYSPLGMGNARFILAEPVANRLFFAGEATHTAGHLATVHGAIETGWRAAAELLAS